MTLRPKRTQLTQRLAYAALAGVAILMTASGGQVLAADEPPKEAEPPAQVVQDEAKPAAKAEEDKAKPPSNAEKDKARSPAKAPKDAVKTRASYVADLCQRIEAAAQERKLPPAFFARLIWTESRFDPNAVSPKGAAGVAQFMPGTARDRGLEDPFDHTTAIPASAHYLADLHAEFGNLGLAAAAYNAGPGRVRNWRAGRTGLPVETHNFVFRITGVTAHSWKSDEPPKADYTLDKKASFVEGCRKMPTSRFRKKPSVTFAGAAKWHPWNVALTADWSHSRALSRYSRMQRQFPKVLAGASPMVLRAGNHSFGKARRFNVGIGKPTQAQAIALCKRLRQAGGVCLVQKTRR